MRAVGGFLLLMLLCNLNTIAKADNETIRSLFHSAKNENDLNQILDYQEKIDNSIAESYFGSVIAMKAQYCFSPIKKYQYFIDGTELIDKSIADGQVVENTYLRLLIQLNTPSFLGYDSNIQNDIYYIEKNIDDALLSIEWKITILEKILLFESNEYNFQGLKHKLLKYKKL